MWGYLIGGAVIAAFAAYYDSVPMLLCAFVVVCAFRIYEQRCESRWTPIWRSVIDKYEAALLVSNDSVAHSDDPS